MGATGKGDIRAVVQCRFATPIRRPPEHGENIITYELLAKVVNEDLLYTHLLSLGTGWL